MRTIPAGGERGATALIAVASGLGAVAADTHATAMVGSDVVAAMVLGVGVVLASSRSGRWAWVAAAVASLASASGLWPAVAGTAGAAVAAVALRRGGDRHHRLVGALVGAAVVQTLLRQPDDRFGVNAVLSGFAIGCLAVSAWSRLGGPARASVRRVALVGGVLVGAAVAGLVLSLALARGDVEAGVSRAQDGLTAARKGESDDAAARLEGAAGSFDAAHADLDAWWAKPALMVPVVGQHARSLEVLTRQGADLATTAATSARSARLEDLRVVDGRLDLDRVRSMAAPLATASDALHRASVEVTRAESPWLIAPVASQVREFERSVAEATEDAAIATDAVAVLPDLLGGDGRRDYFVAFGTPAETRELGGFMGAYAILRAEDGELSLLTTGRVRNLNLYFYGQELLDPSVFPDHYLALLPQRFWHNITGTADFPTVAEAVHQQWRPPSGGTVDGVIYMDPATLGGLLDLTGPIRVPDYDEPLTAENAADFLLRDQYIAFPDDDRHDFLVDAAETVFDELTSGELPGPRALADALGPAVRGRRLLLQSEHPAEQALFERLEIDGGLRPVEGDFLSVRSSNRGLNKIDAFMQRTVAYDVTVDPGRGVVHSTVTVTVRNDAPESGLPYSIIGNRLGKPSGTNSTTVAIYTPLGLVDVTQGGQSISRGAIDEYDRFRYSVLLDVPAGREITVVFELEGPMDLSEGYHLEVMPQPLVNDDELRVEVRGSDGWWAHGRSKVSTDLDDTEQLDVALWPWK